MRLLSLLAPAAVAALITFGLAPVIRRIAIAVGAIDRPGDRKIHSTPTPRLGGLAVVISAGVVFAGLYWLKLVDTQVVHTGLLPGIAIGVLPLLIVSIVDDIHPLSAAPKFLAQLVSAGIATMLFGIHLAPSVHIFDREITVGWMAVPISMLWIIGITNAFNLIDGLDGLSAGLALISSVTLAAVSLVQSSYGVAGLALILGGALIGFLPFNVYPASMFLGDSGATAIGYTLACIAVGGISPRVSAGMAVLVPLVVLGVPIADTLLSILRRVVRRLTSSERVSIFAGDRQHIHHRLIDMGLHHKHAVLVLYIVGLLFSACAIASMYLTSQTAALLLLTVMAAGLIGISRLGYDEFALIRRGVMLKYYDSALIRTSLFVVFVDLALSVVALYASIVLKFDDWTLSAHRAIASNLLALMPAVTLTVFCACRIYWRTWRQARIADLLRPASAAVVSALLLWAICRATMADRPPFTFFALYALVLAPGVVAVRASYRFVRDWTRRAASDRSDAMPVVIYAAGGRGAMALQNLLSNDDHRMRPIGFIDDDPIKVGKYVSGYRVFGTVDVLPDLVAKESIRAVIVASKRISPERLRRLREVCSAHAIALLSFSTEYRVDEFQISAQPEVVHVQSSSVPVPLYHHPLTEASQ